MIVQIDKCRVLIQKHIKIIVAKGNNYNCILTPIEHNLTIYLTDVSTHNFKI